MKDGGHVYTDDEEEDQTREPGMRGADPAAQSGGPMMRTTAAPGGGDIRTMAAGGPMGGRFGGAQGGPQMPWQQPQQGQPNWGSIVDRFRQRFAQHNPFLARLQGGAPGQMPPQAAPGAAPGQGAPAAPPQGANPWADRIAQAAARFGGNRQPGGIMGGRGQY